MLHLICLHYRTQNVENVHLCSHSKQQSWCECRSVQITSTCSFLMQNWVLKSRGHHQWLCTNWWHTSSVTMHQLTAHTLRTNWWHTSPVTMHQLMAHTHTLQHAVPHLCRAQYCRVRSVICCYATRSRFADSTSWLGLKPYILYYFILSLHKLSTKYCLYIHTPQSKGLNKMLNDRNTNGTFSEEDINGLKVKVLPN